MRAARAPTRASEERIVRLSVTGDRMPARSSTIARESVSRDGAPVESRRSSGIHAERTDVLRRNNVTVTGNPPVARWCSHTDSGAVKPPGISVAPQFESDFKVVLFDHVGAGGSDLGAYRSRKVRLAPRLRRRSPRDSRGARRRRRRLRRPLRQRDDRRARRQPRPSRFGSLILVGPSPRYVNDGEYAAVSSRSTSRPSSTLWMRTISVGPPMAPR